MNFKEVFVDSLKFPVINLKQWLILIILFIGSPLVLPFILGMGYLLRIIESSSNGSNEAPKFNEWKSMFKDGLKYIMGIIIITIPIGILMFKGVNLDGNDILSILNSTLVNLVLYYFFIMALANMAHTKRLKAFFDIRTIFELIKKLGKGKYFIFVLIFTLMETMITAIVVLPNLGALEYMFLILFALSYLQIFQSRFGGLVYLKANSLSNEENN
jgi:flagellar biosynthesis protein FlhB